MKYQLSCQQFSVGVEKLRNRKPLDTPSKITLELSVRLCYTACKHYNQSKTRTLNNPNYTSLKKMGIPFYNRCGLLYCIPYVSAVGGLNLLEDNEIFSQVIPPTCKPTLAHCKCSSILYCLEVSYSTRG